MIYMYISEAKQKVRKKRDVFFTEPSSSRIASLFTSQSIDNAELSRELTDRRKLPIGYVFFTLLFRI